MLDAPQAIDSKKSAKADTAHGSLFDDFFHSIAYSAVQSPLNGVTQLIDHVAHTNIEKNTQFIDAPAQAQFGSLAWHAETIGSAIGMVLPFLATKKVLSPLNKVTELSGAASALENPGLLGMSLKESAMTGFVYSSVLTPSDGQTNNFWKSRVDAGLGGAATFTTLTAGSIGLGKVAESGALGSVGSSILRNPIGAGVISGLPAGLVSTEVNSALSNGKSASMSDVAQSMYSMSVIGGVFGAKAYAGQSMASVPESIRAKGSDFAQKLLARVPSPYQGRMLPSFAYGDGLTEGEASVNPEGAEENHQGAAAHSEADAQAARSEAEAEHPTATPDAAATQETAATPETAATHETAAIPETAATHETAATPETAATQDAAHAENAPEKELTEEEKAAEAAKKRAEERAKLSPEGLAALDILEKLEKEPSDEERRKGEHYAMSLDEAKAMNILQKESYPLAYKLYEEMARRGLRTDYFARTVWWHEVKLKPDSPTLEERYPDIRKHALFYEASVEIPNTEAAERPLFYETDKAPDLETPEEIKDFVRFWMRFDVSRPGAMSPRNPNPEAVIEMSKWPVVNQLPDWSLRPIYEHYKATGKPFTGDVDVDQLLQAARGWEAAPSMPEALAAEIGTASATQRLAAAIAWPEALSKFGIESGDSATIDQRPDYDKMVDSFKESQATLSKQGRAQLVTQLKDDVHLPLAIEAVHGRALNAEEQIALKRGLYWADEPYKVLPGVKGATFAETWNALKTVDTPNYKDGWPRVGVRDLSALNLAQTFKGSWRAWVQMQEKAGYTSAEAGSFYRPNPAEDQVGLGQFILDNGGRKSTELTPIVRGWRHLSEDERKQPFADVLKSTYSKYYKDSKDPDFAVEAGKANTSLEDYPKIEARYLASLSTPMPFPTDLSWTQSGLTGRFIPRNDPRGVFLGEHSNSCQHPGGNAQSSAWYGQESPNSGYFVVEDRKGNVVAQSWAMVTAEGGVLFDNVEAKGIEKRQAAVASIYQRAADYLAQNHHTVTLGTGNSDLVLTDFPKADDKNLTVPFDFSGYTDAQDQVLLAQNDNLAAEPLPATRFLRGVLNTDQDQLSEISKARYPEGWKEVQWDKHTSGVLVEDPDRGVLGYALWEPEKHYVSDLAMRPDAKAHDSIFLMAKLMQVLQEGGGEWSADFRASTSYRLIKSLARTGRVSIASDTVNDTMQDEDMHHVVFTVNNPDAEQAKTQEAEPSAAVT